MRADLQLGMRVVLFVPTTNDDEGQNFLPLPSIIEELPDDELLLIQMPMHQGYFYPLPLEPMQMRFFYDNVPYSMMVQYERRVGQEGFLMAQLRRKGPIKSHQMRDYFRVSCRIPVEFKLVIKPGKNPETKDATGLALDLSEGGMMLTTNEKLKMYDRMFIKIVLDSEEELEGQVVRVDDQAEGAKFRYKTGIKFKYTYKGQARRIYKYVVRIQMEQLKR